MPTYTLISSVTVGSGGASTIDFNSIPSTYTDLILKLSTRSTAANIATEVRMRFNSDTGANYNWTRAYSDGSSTVSQRGSIIGAPYTSFILGSNTSGANTTSNTFGNSEYYIPNYAGSTQKSISNDAVLENNATEAYAYLAAGIWTNTSAINAISLFTNGANFVQYSTAYLYGISNA